MNKLHWMRKPRWYTKDENFAKNSIYQWSECYRSEKYNDPREWELTILGAVNGIMALTGYVLVSSTDIETQETKSWSIKKKWW